MAKKSSGWPSDRNLVLFQLKELNKWAEQSGKTQTKIREDIAGLKVKSGIWGLIGGSIPVAMILIREFLKG